MEKTKIKIAALQLESVIGDVDANLEKVRTLLEKGLRELTPNIIILPEVWNVGWDCKEFRANAESFSESKTIELLKEISKKYNSYILGGSIIENENNEFFNSCPVISPNGEIIAKYRKNHLFSYYDCNEGFYVKRGENPVIVTINGYKIGLSICYDIRFPEIYRAYRKAGADVLVNMAAWPLGRKKHWLSLTRARAVENQSYFIALTQTGTLSDGSKNLGHSLIYDYNGEVLDEIINSEGIIYAELDLKPMYEFREKCTVLNDIHTDYEVIKC